MSRSGTDVDPHILGQLLAAQSTISVFSVRQTMGEFVCHAVEGIPGVGSCAVCMSGAERPLPGGEPIPECADCDVPEGDIDHDPGLPCRLPSHTGLQVRPLRTQGRHFGFCLIKVTEPKQYAPYEPFVSNLIDSLAVNVERQWQRESLRVASDELLKHRDHLQELVEQRTAELQASQKALVEAQAVGRLGNWEWDTIKDELTGSEEFYRLFDVVPEELTQFSQFLERLHPDDRESVRRSVAAALKQDRPYDTDYRVKLTNGGWREINARGRVFAGADGKPERMMGTCLDITERKQAEEESRRSQELRIQAEELGRVGGWEFDIETQQQTWTEMVYEIHELDITGHVTVDQGVNFYTPASRPIIEQAVQRAIEQGEPFDLELDIITAKGNLRSVHAIGKADPARRRVSGFFQDITERKQAEEALRKSEAEYRLIADNASDWIYLVGPDGKFSYVSPSCERLTRYAPTEFARDPSLLVGIVHPDDREDTAKHLSAARKETPPDSREYRIVTKTGEMRWISHSCAPVHGPEGEYLGRRGTNRDITERKQAEEALRESEVRFSVAFHSSPIATSITRLADGRYIAVNNAFLAVFGYTREETLSHTSLQMQTWATPEERERVVALLREHGRIREIEALYRRKSGEVWTGLASAEVIEAAGERYVLALLQDLTECKQAEEAVRRSHALLDAVVEGTSDVIYVMDLEGRFLLANAGVERMTGKSADEILGHDVTALFPPGTAARMLENDRKVLEKGTALSFENSVAGPDGTLRTFLSTIGPVPGEDGEVIGLFGISRDITEREEAKAALEAQLDAEKASQTKSEFLSRMSHELRTPLNAVLGYGQLLEMEKLGEPHDASVHEILVAGRHLLDLLGELMDISRIEAGSAYIALEPVDVAGAVSSVVNQARVSAEAAGVSLAVGKRSSPTAFALADPKRLVEVLDNLVSNAIKYNRKGGTVTVSVGATEGGQVLIEVTDTGIGIAPEHMDRLWDPFERLGAEQGGVQGTGLGLSLVKSLVEAMGGAIRAKSEAGVGSTFTVELPQAELPEARESPGAEKVGEAPSRRTVLHIEDNRNNLLLLGRVLGLRPEVDLLEARTGREGLDLAAEHRPALILLDLGLPDISGEECLRMLKEDERTRGIPVVVVSATASPEKIEDVLTAGAAGYLTKPIDVQRVLAVVDDITRTS